MIMKDYFSCPGDDLEEGELDEESQQGGQPAQPSVTSESSVALSAPIPTLTSTTAAVAVSQQQQSHSHSHSQSQSQSSSTSAATSAAMGQTSGEERSIEESQPPSGSGAGQATAAPAKIQPIVWESSSSSSECGIYMYCSSVVCCENDWYHLVLIFVYF